MSSKRLYVNTRILAGHLTGVQRYLRSILDHLPDELEAIAPRTASHGIKGHAWEQFALPFLLHGDLLWSPSNTGPLAVKKQVLTVHDLVPVDHPEYLNPRFAAWYRFLLPRLTHRVKHIIAVSHFTKQRLIDAFGVPAENITVIWNGVDERFSLKSEDEIVPAIEKLGIPSRRYVFSLGSLEPRKNLSRLLQAWQKIMSLIPDDVWLVIGGAKGKSMVFEGVNFDPLPPRVFLTGHVPDDLLPQIYAGAIVSPYLSVYEGFGLPPLEAMACGTPVITGNLTALPEVVGNAGILVDPLSVDDIAYAMLKVITDQNVQMELGRRGLQRTKMFDWNNAAQQTWDVLEKAAAS